MNAGGVVRARLRLVRNAFLPRGRRAPRRHLRPWLSLVLIGFFAAIVAGTMRSLFAGYAASGYGPDAAAPVLALVLGVAAIGLLVFDLHYAVSALLLDSDLELLRRAPIPRAALLGIKLVDSLPRTTALVLVLAAPAAWAFAVTYPTPWWGGIAIAAQLAGLWALPLGLGIALALLLLRFVPARRAREGLALLSTLTITGIWLLNSFVLPRMATLEGPGLEGLPAPPVAGAALPVTWAARGMAAAAADRPGEALGWTALLVLAGAVALGLAAVVAGRQLDAVSARLASGEAPRRRRAEGTARRRPPGRSMIAAVMRKDARLLRREWTVLSDVLTAAALWTLLPLVAAPLGSDLDPAWVAGAMLLALTFGLGYEVAARCVPFERDGLAWLKLAPVRIGGWMAAKLAGAAFLAFGLLALAATSVGLSRPVDPGRWLEILVVAGSALVFALGLGFWTGVVFGDPKWTNPRAMLHLSGRLVATFLLLIQALAWFLLLVMADRLREVLPPGLLLWGPPLLAAAAVSVPLGLAYRRLTSGEWQPGTG